VFALREAHLPYGCPRCRRCCLATHTSATPHPPLPTLTPHLLYQCPRHVCELAAPPPLPTSRLSICYVAVCTVHIASSASTAHTTRTTHAFPHRPSPAHTGPSPSPSPPTPLPQTCPLGWGPGGGSCSRSTRPPAGPSPRPWAPEGRAWKGRAGWGREFRAERGR